MAVRYLLIYILQHTNKSRNYDVYSIYIWTARWSQLWIKNQKTKNTTICCFICWMVLMLINVPVDVSVWYKNNKRIKMRLYDKHTHRTKGPKSSLNSSYFFFLAFYSSCPQALIFAMCVYHEFLFRLFLEFGPLRWAHLWCGEAFGRIEDHKANNITVTELIIYSTDRHKHKLTLCMEKKNVHWGFMDINFFLYKRSRINNSSRRSPFFSQFPISIFIWVPGDS